MPIPSSPVSLASDLLAPARVLGAGLALVLAETRATAQTAPPPSPAPAQESAREEQRETAPAEIPEVLITAEAVQEEVLEHTPLTNPAARDVLSPKEVRESGTMNLQELFRRTPSASISEETGSDSLPNIALRGVTGNDGLFRSVNVTMLVDGIPMASAPYSHPGASLFPLLRERVYAVDVQRGGASVRYGPNNVAGVINYLTRPIPERTTYEIITRYDSFENATVYNALGGRAGRFGYLLEGDYKWGETYREHGDHVLQNYSLKTAYDFSEDVRALVQIEQFDDDSDLADGLSQADFEQDPFQSTSLQNRFFGNQQRVNGKLEMWLDGATRAELVSYYYDSERTFELGSPLFYGDDPDFIQETPRTMEVFAVQPQVFHSWTMGDVDNELLVGVRYLREDVNRQVARTFPDGTHTLLSSDDYLYDTGSAFVENRMLFGDWTVVPGVRFETVDIEAENMAGLRVERDFTELLPALSASCLVDEHWAVFGNVQSAFQPPASNQIELSTDPQDVEAQYAWIYEVGTRAWTAERGLEGDLTLYQIEYSDRLEPDPDQFDVLLNSGRSRHRGVELTLDGDLGALGLRGLGVWSTLAYNDSEYTNGPFNGNETPSSPHWMASWGTRYEHEPTGLWGGIDGFFVDESYSDRENTEEIDPDGTRGVKPSHVVWGAHAGWDRELTRNCRLRVQLDARNVFDEEYFDVRAARGLYVGPPFGYGAEIGLVFGF